jgi:prepilin-type N-terminal cleavage/methylation domain-containing protein
MIELLVVMFVISILAALFFSGIQMVRESVRKADCQNNL